MIELIRRHPWVSVTVWLLGAVLFASSLLMWNSAVVQQYTAALSSPPQVVDSEETKSFHAAWVAARVQFPEELVDRIFVTYKKIPEFHRTLEKYGYAVLLPPMLVCLNGLTEKTPDADAADKLQCGWRVISLVLMGPRAQAMLEQNASVTLKAFNLYGGTKEWAQAVSLGSPLMVGILRNCLEGKGDFLIDASDNLKRGFKNALALKMPDVKWLAPEECGWYAVQRMATLKHLFFYQFIEKDEQVERLTLSSAAVFAVDLLAGNIRTLDENWSLHQVTPKNLGMAALDVVGLVAIAKLPALAVKAMTLGWGPVAVTTGVGAGAIKIVTTIGVGAIKVALPTVVAVAGVYLAITNPVTVTKIGGAMAQAAHINPYVGYVGVWLIPIGFVVWYFLPFPTLWMLFRMKRQLKRREAPVAN